MYHDVSLDKKCKARENAGATGLFLSGKGHAVIPLDRDGASSH